MSKRSEHLKGRPARTSRWRRRIVITALLLIALVAGGVYFLTRPARLAGMAGTFLSDLTSAQVHIQSATIGFDGSIHVQGVTFDVPDPDDHPVKVFEANSVIIRHDLTNLVTGRFTARSVTLDQPVLYVTEDLDHGLYNYQMLKIHKDEQKDDTPDLPDTLPQVVIRQGEIRIGEISNHTYKHRGTVHVTGGLEALSNPRNTYRYLLIQDIPLSVAAPRRQAAAERPTQSTLSGEFNLETLAINAKLEGFALRGVHRQLLPRKLRKWWDQYEPAGSMPDIQFGYDPAVGLHAKLEVQDVGLTLPFGEQPARMQDVSGMFTIVGEKASVTRLRGKIEGIPYEINGQIDGLEQDAPFDMTVDIASFEIPKEPKYLLALPRVVQKQFTRFAPSGTFSATVNIKRTSADADIQYDGQLRINNAQGVYAKFPYPLKDVKGSMRFNNQELRIVSLQGSGLSGGKVHLTGVITPPRDDAAVKLNIVARQIPIDEHLFGALTEQELGVVTNFLDTRAQARLEQQGLLNTPDKASQIQQQIQAITRQQASTPADQPAYEAMTQELERLRQAAARPTFSLGGKIDLDVTLNREYGPDVPYLPTTTINTHSLGVIAKAWNYPLRITGGQLIIAPGKATLKNIQVQGLDGTTGTLTGDIGLPRKSVPGSRSDPDVNFTAANMPVGPLLLSSLPRAQSQWIQQLQVQGNLQLAGRIYRTKDPSNDHIDGSVDANDGPMDFDIHTKLVNAVAKPFDGRVDMKNITGEFVIHRNHAAITNVTGQFDQATMKLAGKAAWPNKQTDLQLDIQARDVSFEQHVLDLVPGDGQGITFTRQQNEIYQPQGVYDANVALTIKSKADPQFRVTVMPKSLSFLYHDHRVALEKTTGQVRIDPETIIIDNLTGVFDETATIAADGKATLGDKPRALVNLKATGRRFDPTTLALLPPGVSQFVKDVELEGSYELVEGVLDYRPREEEVVGFTGQANITGGKATLGVALAQIDGMLEVDAQTYASKIWPEVRMKVNAQKLTASQRLIEDLTATIHTNDQPGMLVIPDLAGRVYHGKLAGQAQVQMGEVPTFAAQLTVQNAAVQAVVEPATWPAMPQQRDPMDASPYAALSANLAIAGQSGVIHSRQGRGRVEIRNASLYQTPIALKLLQILSLTWPSATSFDRANATYVIDGDTVHFDTIRFETPGLALLGQGTMSFSTQALDLNFVTRSTRGPSLGPLSELVSVVKDEILAIHIGGTLEKPVTSVKSFSSFTQAWNEVFGNNPDAATAQPPQRLPGY